MLARWDVGVGKVYGGGNALLSVYFVVLVSVERDVYLIDIGLRVCRKR